VSRSLSYVLGIPPVEIKKKIDLTIYHVPVVKNWDQEFVFSIISSSNPVVAKSLKDYITVNFKVYEIS